MMNSKRQIILRIVAVGFLLGLFLAGCSPKDKLLGVWDEQGGNLHIRFHTGDSISQRAIFGEDTLTLTGSYSIVNGSQIQVDFAEGDWQGLKSGLYDFSISGNELHLGDMAFERQPDVYSLGE